MRKSTAFLPMSSFIDDIRYSARSLLRAPAFTATAVLVLAIGIGINAAVFSVVNALLLKPVGGGGRGELVGLYLRDPGHPGSYQHFTYRDYNLIREAPGALSAVLAHEFTTVGVDEGGISRKAFVSLVSSSYFATLASRPALGRDFKPEEERVGASSVAIVSDSYWRRMGADPSLPGKTLRVNAHDVTVIGVAPRGFSGATAMVAPDLWLPLGACAFTSSPASAADASGCLEAPDRRTLSVVGRLRPGASRTSASASLAGIARGLGGRGPGPAGLTVSGVSRLSIGAGPSGDSEVAMVMLFLAGIAASVLLIASLNLANMQLARGTARQYELALRIALGAGRWRTARLPVIESALLTGTGTLLGLGLSAATTSALSAAVGRSVPFGIVFDAVPDARVVSAALGFALLACLVSAFGPAVASCRADALARLKDQAGQSRRGAGRMSARNTLAVVQLATSLALLTAAGLFARGAFNAARANTGFEVDGRIVATVAPALSGYDDTRGREIYAGAVAMLRADPSVASASLCSSVPFSAEPEAAIVRDASARSRAGERIALVSATGADHFRTLGVRILRGREFDEREERAPSPSRPAIVNQAMAEQMWPSGDPIGQRVQVQAEDGGWDSPVEVVGVVASFRQNAIESRPPAQLYLPFGSAYRGEAHLHARLRAAGPAAEAAALAAVRKGLRELDASLAVLRVDTLRGHRDRSLHLWVARAGAALFSAFGGAALLLASLGVYGVKAYLVSRRRKEIAVRMALGASRAKVLGLVAGDGVAITAVGLSCGLALAVGLSKVLTSWVAGPAGFDLAPVGTAAAVLTAAALLACYLPVRRATAASPWSVLRSD